MNGSSEQRSPKWWWSFQKIVENVTHIKRFRSDISTRSRRRRQRVVCGLSHQMEQVLLPLSSRGKSICQTGVCVFGFARYMETRLCGSWISPPTLTKRKKKKKQTRKTSTDSLGFLLTRQIDLSFTLAWGRAHWRKRVHNRRCCWRRRRTPFHSTRPHTKWKIFFLGI